MTGAEVSEGREVDLLALRITSALEKSKWEWKPDQAPDKSPLLGENFPDKPFMRARTWRGVVVQVATADLTALRAAQDALIVALQLEGIRNVIGMTLSDDDTKRLRLSYGLIHIVVGTKQ